MWETVGVNGKGGGGKERILAMKRMDIGCIYTHMKKAS
jgi:hypothetical protein